MKTIKNMPQLDGSLGWYQTSSQRHTPIKTRTSSKKDYDYIIIGGGYTGLGVCSRLLQLEPEANIAIVDALKIGEGTSGRNAGFIIDLPHNLDSDNADMTNETMTFRLNSLAIELLYSHRKTYGIECNWQQAGKYLAAHETKHIPALTVFTQAMDSLKADYEFIEKKALAERLGTNYYQAAIYTPGNVLMNPAALIRGIALGLSEQVDIFENSPVTAIDYGKQGKPHTLITHNKQAGNGPINNQLSAKKLVFATNSFTEEFGLLNSRLAPVFTYASLSQVLNTDQQEQFNNVTPWGLTSAHRAGTTVRLTPDKRIFIRNGFNFNPDLTATQNQIDKASIKHRQSFDRRFPQLKGLPFEHTWGGMLCITGNHQPVFSATQNHVYTVAGMNGVGVAKGTYLGHYMAEYINGISSENLDYILKTSKPNWIPPDPFRSMGVRTRLTVELAMAKGEV